MNDDKIGSIKDQNIIPKALLWFIAITIGVLAYGLSEPIFTLIMGDIKLAGFVLTAFMGLLEPALNHITGKALAQGRKKPAFVLLMVGVFYLGFITYGQIKVAEKERQEPVIEFYDSTSFEVSEQEEDNGHLVASALIALVYILGLVVNYLHYKDDLKHEPGRIIRKLSNHLSEVKAQRHLNTQVLERAHKKPQLNAEDKVNKTIKGLRMRITKDEDAKARVEAQKESGIQELENLKQSVITAIHRVNGTNGTPNSNS